MAGKTDPDAEITGAEADAVHNVAELAQLLRRLRRREARRRNDSKLTYRELAAITGWSSSAIGLYLSGKALAPTDRFDILIQLLGAGPAEQGLLATARDRIEESRLTEPAPAPAPTQSSAQSSAQSSTPAPAQSSTPASAMAPAPVLVTGSAPGMVAPHTLPAPTPYFTGRSAEISALAGLLDRQAGTVLISAIGGTAGVGKTALAVHWGHRVGDRFPDGQLYLNLRGFDPAEQTMTHGEALRCMLETLMVPARRIPASIDGQVALYRSLLAGRRMLIVLDNARDTAQVRPLLPGAPGCLVLVTSRNQLSGLIATEGAHPITLDLLTGDEAAELLGHRLGDDRVAAEPEAVAQIVAYCARLPLALAIVSAHAATNPRIPLSAIVSELRDTRRRLAALRGDDPATDVRAVFSWSYRALTPDAARLFRRLGLHPGPDVSTAAAASLDGVPVEVVKSTLAELVRAHLVSEPSPGRYALHDLLRAYAAECASDDPDQHAALRRMCDHYTHSACAAQHVLNALGDPIPLDAPAAGAIVSRHADLAEALAWFSAEHSVLLALIGKSMSGFDRHICRLAWAFAIYLDRRGHWDEWIVVGHTALGAAQRLQDLAAQAHAHRHLARAHTRRDRLDDAAAHLHQALALTRESGDLTAQAHVHLLLSDISASQGGYAQALVHTRDALDMYVAAGNWRGQADALNSIGWYHAMLGDYDRTVTYCRRALILHGSRHGPGIVEATAWDSLGYAHHHLGDHAKAVSCYRRAIELFQELGDRYFESETLTRLGDTHQVAGNNEAAQSVWQRALAILEDLEHPDADEVRSRLAVAAVP